MVKLINLTSHSINLICEMDGGGEVEVEIPPSGIVARLKEEAKFIGVVSFEINGGVYHIPVISKVLGGIENLPPPKEGTVYIASLPVSQKAGRHDVLSIGERILNSKGRTVKAKSLATPLSHKEVWKVGDQT